MKLFRFPSRGLSEIFASRGENDRARRIDDEPGALRILPCRNTFAQRAVLSANAGDEYRSLAHSGTHFFQLCRIRRADERVGIAVLVPFIGNMLRHDLIEWR